MSTYTTNAAPNLLATLWGPLEQIVTPLLADPAPAVTDPGIPELLAALGEALTAAVRATRTAPAAPAPARPPAAVRAPAGRVSTAQVGSVAGEPKPGSLRARLIAYLAEHPGQAFTATELFHALGATSGGAVGAALGTMTAHGEATQVADSPKRYTTPTAATTPTPAQPPADHDPEGANESYIGRADQPDADQSAPEAERPAANHEAAETQDLDTAEESEPGHAPAAPGRGRAKSAARRTS